MGSNPFGGSKVVTIFHLVFWGLAPAEKVRHHAAGNPKTTTFDPMNNKQLQKEDIFIAAVVGWLIWFFAGVAWGLMS